MNVHILSWEQCCLSFCNKIPNTHKLKEESFILIHSLKRFWYGSKSVQHAEDTTEEKWSLRGQAGRQQAAAWSLPFPSIPSSLKGYWMVPPTPGTGLSVIHTQT